MQFTATWFCSEEILSTEKAESFFVARDIARARLAAHRVRSGATHAEVRSQDGALFFDTRENQPPAKKRPALIGGLVKRLPVQRALGTV